MNWELIVADKTKTSTKMNGFLTFIVGIGAGVVIEEGIRFVYCRRHSPVNDSGHKPISEQPTTYYPVKLAFADHYETFRDLLCGVSDAAITNKGDWTSAIINVNNGELTQMWKSAVNNPKLWIAYLKTFGFRLDWTEQFTATDESREMYTLADGQNIEIGKEYKVISPCWIYTDAENNKSVAIKGIVEDGQ